MKSMSQGSKCIVELSSMLKSLVASYIVDRFPSESPSFIPVDHCRCLDVDFGLFPHCSTLQSLLART